MLGEPRGRELELAKAGSEVSCNSHVDDVLDIEVFQWGQVRIHAPLILEDNLLKDAVQELPLLEASTVPLIWGAEGTVSAGSPGALEPLFFCDCPGSGQQGKPPPLRKLWCNGRGSTATSHGDSQSNGLLIICRGLHDLVSPPDIFLQCKILLLSCETLGILGPGHENDFSYCL